MIQTLKCRDCLFKSSDLMKVYEHIRDLGHKEYAVMLGNKVVVDWIHIEMEIKREHPE